MSVSIREYDAKKLLLPNLSPRSVSVSSFEQIEALTPHDFLEGKIVIKPDVLLKRRGASGLVKVCNGWNEGREWLLNNFNKSISVDSSSCDGAKVSGVLDAWIVEEFCPHDLEFYVAIRSKRDCDEILFSDRGGVNVGNIDDHALVISVPLIQDYDGTTSVSGNKLLGGSLAPTREFVGGLVYRQIFGKLIKCEQIATAVSNFCTEAYSSFVKCHLTFVEFNPVALVDNRVIALDCAAKVDHTAEYLCRSKNTDGVCLWPESFGHTFPSPFGRTLTDEEQYIRNLDAKTGASLKLTILNRKGRVWLMVAGGGASVVYADTVCDLGFEKELANYGEYSGDPSENLTFEYCKTILTLMTEADCHETSDDCLPKVLLIGGSIANFTNVAETFRGIIRALRDFADPLRRMGVKIYVRRGGPNYQEGLKRMSAAGVELRLPIFVYGPDTYITEIISMALTPGKALSPSNRQTNVPSPKSQSTPATVADESVERGANSRSGSWGGVDADEVFASARKRTTFAQKTRDSLILDSNSDIQKFQPLMSSDSLAIVYGLQLRAVQEMIDFDHVCSKEFPSVIAIVYEFSSFHVRPFYWGSEEIFLPVYPSMAEAIVHRQFKEALTVRNATIDNVDILVNFASMRSSANVSLEAILKFKNFKTIAMIAEGIPERISRELVWFATERTGENKVSIIGPSTVGGLKAGVFRIGNTGGRLENIMGCKLFRPGSVAFVTKSGGLLNEVNNILCQFADGAYEGIAIGGDRFPGTSLLDHALRYEADPNVKIIVVIGEVGGTMEYEVRDALAKGQIKKPLIAWNCGTCATKLTTEVAFGHAGSWAGGLGEHASAKNAALKAAGALVPSSFHDLGNLVRSTYDGLVNCGNIIPFEEPEVPRVPMDLAWAQKLGLVRKPKHFVSTISDDRGEELVYSGFPISRVIDEGMGIGGVIALLWFKRPLPSWCYKFIELVLQITADHGPAVSGAHNAIVTARAGKDLVSSLCSGLLTIGPRFGGACDAAARNFRDAYRELCCEQNLSMSEAAEKFVSANRRANKLIMGIGHRIKSVHNPDMRVKILRDFCDANFDPSKRPVIDFALAVEEVTTRKKDTLILNVDGLVGASLVDMIGASDAFASDEAVEIVNNGVVNGLFVLGRTVGFIGHFLDQNRLKQGLYRHDVDDISYAL